MVPTLPIKCIAHLIIMDIIYDLVQEGVSLIEGSNTRGKPVPVARVLVEVKSNCAIIRLIHTKSEPVNIYPGKK